MPSASGFLSSETKNNSAFEFLSPVEAEVTDVSKTPASIFLKTGKTFVEPEKETIGESLKIGFKGAGEELKKGVTGALRVGGALVGSAATAIGGGLAGLTGVPTISGNPDELIDFRPGLLTGGSLRESAELVEEIAGAPGKLLKTQEEANVAGLIAKPIELAGEGWQLIGRAAEEQLQDMGLNVSYIEPILGTMGEAAAIIAMPGVLKEVKNSSWFRLKTIPERGLVVQSLAETIKKNPTMTEAQILKKWNNPTFREQALKRRAIKPEAEFDLPGEPVVSTEPIITEATAEPRVTPAQAESSLVQSQFAERFKPAEVVPPEVAAPAAFGEGATSTTPTISDPVSPQLPAADFLKTGEIQGPKTADSVAGEKLQLQEDLTLEQVTETELVPDSERVLDDAKDTGTIPSGQSTLFSGLPLNEVGKVWTENVGSPIWDKGVQQILPKLLEKIPGGKAINRALIYDYRGNLPKTQEFIKSMEGMKRFQAVGREYAIDIGNRLQSLPEDAQLRMGEYIRGELDTLTGEELTLAEEAKQTMIDLGSQAVGLGLLDGEVFFKNVGKYMPRLYTSKEYQSNLNQWGVTKPNRLDLSRFQKRKDIPKEVREDMGEILKPGFPIAKGITQMSHDIEMSRFIDGIARNREWAIPDGEVEIVGGEEVSVSVPEDFVKLPESKRLGKLSGAHVHPEIAGDIQATIKVMETPERVWRKMLGSWKFGKVILSPKTHMRNLMSNSILAHLGGLPLYEQPIYVTKAVKALKSKNELWQEAKTQGLMGDTFTNAELRSLFDQVEIQMKDASPTNMPSKFEAINKVWEGAKKAGQKAANIYEAEEQLFKMAKYIHNVERNNMAPQEAAADAEKWLFNYSKLTKFQDNYRSKWWGAPFSTFSFKSMPRMAETMVKYPWRFALPFSIIAALEKTAQNMMGDTDEQRRAKKELTPDWMKGSFLGTPNFARVPFVDESGREHYLNMSYILPWGDLGEGGQFGPIPGGLMPFSQPFLKEPFQQFANYDTFWKDNIVEQSDIAGLPGSEGIEAEEALSPFTEAGREGLKIRLGHAAQTFAPTPLIDISKGIAALKVDPDYRGRVRDPRIVAADVFGGIKLYPVDYAERASQEIRSLDPSTSSVARQIMGDIQTLEVKKKTISDAGGDTVDIDNQVKQKIEQLKGLGEQAANIGELFTVIRGDNEQTN